MKPNAGHPNKRHRLFGPPWLGFTVIALFAGMLFWSKLRVSSVVPRSAFADPEASEKADADAPRTDAERTTRSD